MFFFFVFIVYQSDICTSYFASAIPLPESEDSSGTVKRTLYVQTHHICIYVEAHVPPGTCRGYMNEQTLKDIFKVMYTKLLTIIVYWKTRIPWNFYKWYEHSRCGYIYFFFVLIVYQFDIHTSYFESAISPSRVRALFRNGKAQSLRTDISNV